MNAEAEAWFDDPAVWKMTVTEISFNAFPQPVRSAFQSGEYSDWRIDDTDMLERRDMETVYIIEVEKDRQEYDLYYSADASLVKAVPDNDGNDHRNYIPEDISSTVSDFISTQYPGARIIEIEKEKGMIEVDILDGNVHRELLFTADGQWKYTKTEIIAASVPKTVMDAFTGSQYASLRIDDIDLYSTLDGDYYIFELDAEPDDIHLKISADGAIEVVVNR